MVASAVTWESERILPPRGEIEGGCSHRRLWGDPIICRLGALRFCRGELGNACSSFFDDGKASKEEILEFDGFRLQISSRDLLYVTEVAAKKAQNVAFRLDTQGGLTK
jgi:hypothetical protein